MAEPRISVIVPTYNRCGVISDAIDSILAQTYKVFEIIIVDDGSTDGTRRILERYGDNIKYIYQDNEGVSAARNRGIKAASGEWLAFLDSDDIWKASKIEAQINVLRASSASVCLGGHEDDFGDVHIDFLPDLVLGEWRYVEQAIDLVIRKNQHPLIQSALVKKDLIQKLGCFDQTLRVAEDTRLIYRIALSTGIAYINDSLFVLRRNRRTSGLSDDIAPRIALIRYQCYAMVQSEVYWHLVPSNYKLARLVGANIGYFLSRQSEIHSVLKEYKAARRLAIEGVKFASDLRTLIRCLVLIVAPGFLGIVYSRKWKTKVVQP